jgi:hypothetical protein
MNVDLVRLVSGEAFRASSTLGNLIPILKAELPEDEYVEFARAIGRCMDQISQTVMEKAYINAPEVKLEHDVRVTKYWRVF